MKTIVYPLLLTVLLFMPICHAASAATPEDQPLLYIDRIANLPGYLRDFYFRLGHEVEAAFRDEPSVLVSPEQADLCIKPDFYAYAIKTFEGELNISVGPADDVDAMAGEAVSKATDAVWNEYSSFMPYVCHAFSMDYPQAFWLRTNYDYYNKTSWSCDTVRAVAAKEERLVRYKFTCYLTLKRPGYDLRRQSMHTEADIRNGIKRYEAALAEILKQIPAEASRREQVLCLNDWLTSHNSYTTRRATPPPSMAYSPLSALEGKSGDDGLVCEAYSRGLKVLCDRLGIPCIVVSGRARDKADRPYEDHLWNYVRMEDGQWYAVDVTWNDPVNTGDEEAAGRACSGFESHKWMLLGSLSDVADGFSFDSSHTEDPSGGYAPAGTLQWNLLPGPALAEQGYADPAASPQ
jgi:hypothetical protein